MRTEQQYNLPEQKAFRKELRNSMTSAEVVLWQMLKGKQIEGFKFRRQFGIGPFVVDFYCPILRLAIELDGAYHFSEEMESYDEQRSLYLARNDIKVLRFENRRALADIRCDTRCDQRKDMTPHPCGELP